ncbi:HAD hydrolase-like protein [Lysobacter humi (ex Lee et al. 2017)]
MQYDLAIFDLDGTLADSFPFFIEAQADVARRHGFAAIAPHEVETMRALGPRGVMRHVGMPRWKLPFVIRTYMRLMRERTSPIPLFDGIGDALAHLQARGMALAVVTSNSRENVDRLLGTDHCSRMRHFECGASMFGKCRRLRRVLRLAGVPASRAIYIGDQLPDGEAAHAAGMDFGAVGWGYATLESLRACGPARVFHHPRELASLAD